uniref:Uncharacterized protein n=1 Tax=Meloidogyne enterolobii TaxID=390850 RepID=A0A6V7V8Z5_MELEN|nr:unnamed protein product [Meloidogyne enterolobii]
MKDCQINYKKYFLFKLSPNFFKFIYFILILTSLSKAEFSPDFAKWLSEYYGEDVRAHLERKDLGHAGSFGGKNEPSEPIRHQPVIFVHGVSNRAWDKMKNAADYFHQQGYSFAELYGTTYANGDEGNPLQWAQYSMKCQYVKLVRALIVAIRLYTGKQVDVIGYSLGVPVSRKAILGGRCVDTGEDLGAPLTKFVDTYVGVAGPNHGISLQLGSFSLPGCALALLPICNGQTGLYSSGFCPSTESAFLQDINRQQGYEGKYRFSLYSQRDQIIGYTVCNKITSQIPSQNAEKVYPSANHDETFLNSFQVQMEMVANHIVI